MAAGGQPSAWQCASNLSARPAHLVWRLRGAHGHSLQGLLLWRTLREVTFDTSQRLRSPLNAVAPLKVCCGGRRASVGMAARLPPLTSRRPSRQVPHGHARAQYAGRLLWRTRREVTLATFQSEMGPYVARACASFDTHSATAVFSSAEDGNSKGGGAPGGKLGGSGGRLGGGGADDARQPGSQRRSMKKRVGRDRAPSITLCKCEIWQRLAHTLAAMQAKARSNSATACCRSEAGPSLRVA